MEILVDGLQKSAARPTVVDVDSEEKYFESYHSEWRTDKRGSKDELIPLLYSKRLDKRQNVLLDKLKLSARTEFLLAREDELVNNDDLKEFCVGLDKMVCLTNSQELPSLTYDELKKLVEKSSEKLRAYFKPSVVLALQRNREENKIAVVDILNYAMRKTWLVQSKIGLLHYDSSGVGLLSESDMENYIGELVPMLAQLEQLDSAFRPFYICGAVRKFMFFLDPLRTGRIKINDVMMSTFLDDILDLRDDNPPENELENNWFSAQTALRVYGEYLYLDSDHNGLLSKEEFAKFGSGTLTSIFIDRIFQECLTYEGEMDYKTYLDLVLALENKHEPQALQYVFRILDVNKCGYIDGFTLNFFFRAVQDQMTSVGQDAVPFADVKDEIFDMINPANPCFITLEDIVQSGQGDEMVSILVELNGFYSYENREARPKS